MKKSTHEKNFQQWNDVSNNYHEIRPKPPTEIVNIILSWLKNTPDVVVDVGCGTGLSTTIWTSISAKTIGIEPNDDMRAAAEKHINTEDGIVFQKGVSNDTTLPSDYADVITVSQAFHWMDIDSTLVEFFRVLKRGGILAIYDFMLPPIVGWEIEKAFIELRTKCFNVWYSQETPPIHNDKSSYNDRIKSFGQFRYSREVKCHGKEIWPIQKAISFLTHISNADFAIQVDSSIKKDIDNFNELIKSKHNGEIEIIFPYAMVLAIK